MAKAAGKGRGGGRGGGGGWRGGGRGGGGSWRGAGWHAKQTNSYNAVAQRAAKKYEKQATKERQRLDEVEAQAGRVKRDIARVKGDARSQAGLQVALGTATAAQAKIATETFAKQSIWIAR